ncbi:MAG: HesA/MoeB/ThiF family protein [Bacteroides sp.]|nr:HesA/MoeB/ThiF family protein [Roseburia sp.]MCM1345517.1 HesA/MoeB/ThiF family protein [Bacteroides sp.]MCM1420026.1 HesA/MoeB/ThiF family protein [Bacteroides sp.]
MSISETFSHEGGKDLASRYCRHMLLAEMGQEGQERICKAKVLVVGVGGLGSPVALYLAASGVGAIGLVDADVVDESNLHRQVIHDTASAGISKVLSAKARMLAVNPEMQVNTYNMMFDAGNAEEIIRDYDFVVDATDNFTSKYLINDVCVRIGKPFSHGSVIRFGGMTMTHIPGSSTYRDVFPVQPETRDEDLSSHVGILGTVPGIIGTIQATEVLKYVSGVGELLINRLLTFDALTMQFSVINLA